MAISEGIYASVNINANVVAGKPRYRSRSTFSAGVCAGTSADRLHVHLVREELQGRDAGFDVADPFHSAVLHVAVATLAALPEPIAYRMFRVRPLCRSTALAVVLTSLLAACGLQRKAEPPPSGETFGAEDTYSRTYPVPSTTACEATRRALLGQGYVISKAAPDALEATKSFQPESDVHTQLNVRATCVPQTGGGSIVFVNAVQDRYVLNTTVKSASVGVSMLGSVSLPIGSSGANLVRVASNTVQNQDFYRRFFERVAYYVPSTEGLAPPPPPPVFETLPPDPVPPVPAPIAPSSLDEALDPPAETTDPS